MTEEGILDSFFLNRKSVKTYFTIDNKSYYADLSLTSDCGNECMIFEIENGRVNWSEVYCKHNIPITKTQLTKCIREFCKKQKYKFSKLVFKEKEDVITQKD